MIPHRWLGRTPYGEALVAQRTHRAAILAGEAQEVIWLLEHDPVVTVGRRPAPGTPSPETLAAQGVAFHAVERGGLATWHGPGQLVAYLMVDAATRRIGVKGLVCAVEQGVITWLSQRGVQAQRRGGYPGVWVLDGIPQKICAVGMHFRRGVSMHGIALNLSPDLSGFSLITPCGITDGGVTTLARLQGTAPTPEQAADSLGAALAQAIVLQEKKSA
ncbi:MAG: lipoyl(octanoyl) transferase [Myxococcota bacterium]